MKVLPLGALAVCLFAGPARADLEYAFNVTSSTSLQPFSFSFTSPTFLADNGVPTFTPFTVTDGANSWMLSLGLAVEGGTGCFEFGTAAGSSLGTCSVGTDGDPQSAALLLELEVPLPTVTGTYDFMFAALAEDSTLIGPLGGSLNITGSAVPEPSSIGLLGAVLAAVGWQLSRRYAPRAL